MTNKLTEIKDELILVLGKNQFILESVLPSFLFLILNYALGWRSALVIVSFGSLARLFWHILYKQYKHSELLGFISFGVTATLTLTLDDFRLSTLPGIANTVLTLTLLLISIIAKKPLVALTSQLIRKWPIRWYEHPLVYPAYLEVSWSWVFYFTIKLSLQILVLQSQEVALLSAINTLLGWPATTALLIVSYLYGTWRLQKLKGPSVEEFRSSQPSPWQSQRKGF